MKKSIKNTILFLAACAISFILARAVMWVVDPTDDLDEATRELNIERAELDYKQSVSPTGKHAAY